MAARNYKKIGEASAKRGDYYKAIENYEWCANNHPGVQSPIYCFEAGMCHIGTEVCQIQNHVHRALRLDWK